MSTSVAMAIPMATSSNSASTSSPQALAAAALSYLPRPSKLLAPADTAQYSSIKMEEREQPQPWQSLTVIFPKDHAVVSAEQSKEIRSELPQAARSGRENVC